MALLVGLVLQDHKAPQDVQVLLALSVPLAHKGLWEHRDPQGVQACRVLEARLVTLV